MKNCNNKCCDLYDDINENDDQYIIERLEDIVKIANFLINVLKHKKMKEDTFNALFEESKDISESKELKEKEKTDNDKFFELLRMLMKEPSYDSYYGRYNPYTVRF